MKLSKLTKRDWLLVAYFAALAFVGLLIGAILWGLGFGPHFFAIFCISYPFAIIAYFSLLSSAHVVGPASKKQKVFASLSFLLRFLSILAALGFSYLYLFLYTNKNVSLSNAYYLLIVPVVAMFGYLAIILISPYAKREREEK